MRSRNTVVAVALCLFSSAASAEPVVITHGWMQILNVGGDVDIPVPHQEFLYSLSRFPDDGVFGDAYSTSGGGLRIAHAPLPVPWNAGAPFNLSSAVTWTFGDFNDCTPAGSDCGLYRSSGSFTFSAGDSTLLAGEGMLVGHAPFSFRGAITAMDAETRAPAFARQFSGQGSATFSVFPETRHFSYLYEVEAVPEPATILLLGSALSALALGQCFRVVRRRGPRRGKG
jgi:hypothetical protein